LTIAISINGPSYAISSSTCAAGVTAGNSCMLQIQFSPVGVGERNDSLTLTTNGTTNPVVSLVGTAAGVGPLYPSLQFGSLPLGTYGTTEVLPLTILNVGVAGTVTLTESINGPSYKILTTAQNTCMAGITAGESCVLPVEFDPAAVGPHDDFLTLTPSSGSTPSTVRLRGIATP
jgi:hypothetical protein